VAVAETVPLFTPAQLSVEPVVLTVSAVAGCEMLTLAVPDDAPHVAVTVYVPAASPVAVWEFCPFDQRYV